MCVHWNYSLQGLLRGQIFTLQIGLSKFFHKIVSHNNFKLSVYYYKVPLTRRYQLYVMENMCVYWNYSLQGQLRGQIFTFQILPPKLFWRIVSQNNFKSRVYYFELPLPHRLQSYVMNNMNVYWNFSVQGPVRGQIFCPPNMALKSAHKGVVSYI